MAWSEATQPPPTDETRRVDNPEGRQSLGRRQCVATKSDGTRCKKPPHRGGTCCILHGGASPLAKMQAQRMLLSMVEPAAAILMLAVMRCEFEWIIPVGVDGQPDEKNKYRRCMVHEDDGCPDWSVRVNAGKALLDRSGHGPQAKITLSHDNEGLDKLDNDALATELEKLSRDLRIDSKSAPTETHDAEFTVHKDEGTIQ